MSPEVIPLISVALNILVALVGLTWGIGRLRDAVQQEVRHEIDTLRNRIDDELDNLGRSFGETISAIREKINQVEIAAYKDFVRNESFREIVNRISSEIANYRVAIEGRLDRQEAKIDRLIVYGPDAGSK